MANDTPEDYYDTIHRKTWARRTAGILGGATLFGACGAVGGVIASYFPYVLSALKVEGVTAAASTLPFAPAVLTTAAIFGAAAALVGVVIATDVGANAGSISAGLEEKEKRENLGNSPSKDIDKNGQQAVKKPRLFNWKTAVVCAGLFALFGAALGFATAPISFMGGLGLVAGSNAAIAASSAIFGMFGATLGTNFPVISNKLSNFYLSVLNGKIFEKTPAIEVTHQPQREMEKTVDAPAISEQPSRIAGKFAANVQSFSLQGIIEKTEEQNPQIILR